MKKLNVSIPTYRRTDKLLKCLESINIARKVCTDFEININVYFSDQQELESVSQRIGVPGVSLHLLQKEFKASVFWNDILRDLQEDALCYLTDDVEVNPYCFVEAWNHLVMLDFDGVVGLKIENATDGQPCRAAFGMLGKEFTRRFPDSQVFCPEYWCFYLDKELEDFATSIGRFYFCKQARIKHFHPDFVGETPDECHTHHRRNSKKDVSTNMLRRADKLLWGQSFDLVEQKEECDECGSCCGTN